MAGRPVVNRVVAGDGDPRHGKPSTYSNHGCRCPRCTQAHTRYLEDYREKRRRNGGKPLREKNEASYSH